MGRSCIHIESGGGEKRNSAFDRFPCPAHVLLFGKRGFGESRELPFADRLCKREKKMNRIIKKKSVWIEYNELSVSDG